VIVKSTRSLKARDRAGARSFASSQGGQSLVEFIIGSIVLMLLLSGLLDFGRVFFFDVAIHGSAYAGARHAIWFDTGSHQNRYLDDADITLAVNRGLTGAGMAPVNGPQGTCPAGLDNSVSDPPYAASLYPTGLNAAYLYICYTRPGGGSPIGTLTTAPGPFDTSWRLGDVNVIVLLNYGLATTFMQSTLNAFGGIHVASNAHFTVQGGQ
jgi:TadE-like protein